MCTSTISFLKSVISYQDKGILVSILYSYSKKQAKKQAKKQINKTVLLFLADLSLKVSSMCGCDSGRMFGIKRLKICKTHCCFNLLPKPSLAQIVCYQS